MTEESSEDKELQSCVSGLCQFSRGRNGPVKRAIGTALGLISPVLVRSVDPRVKALGLALGILRATVYKPRVTR